MLIPSACWQAAEQALALEDDRIRPRAKDKVTKSRSLDTLLQLDGQLGDRRPTSSDATAYEVSKVTPKGIMCALKEHRCGANLTLTLFPLTIHPSPRASESWLAVRPSWPSQSETRSMSPTQARRPFLSSLT